jgi:hypothetical protein
MKNCLEGVSFSSEKKFLFEIHEALRRISSVTLLISFDDWMKRLVWIARYKNYYDL